MPSLVIPSFVVFLSTHAVRQGVLYIVYCLFVCLFVRLFVCLFACLFVCTVTDFSAEDKASVVKFCMVIHRRPRQGISLFVNFAPPKSPKSDASASARGTPTGM